LAKIISTEEASQIVDVDKNKNRTSSTNILTYRMTTLKGIYPNSRTKEYNPIII